MTEQTELADTLALLEHRRAEARLMSDYADAQETFLRAKARRGKDPAGYSKAKTELDRLRTYWRRIGEAVGTRTPVAPVKGGRR